jgi:hypothetical protein
MKLTPVGREKMRKTHSYKEAVKNTFVRKICLLNVGEIDTGGVDFTNILCAAFMHADPKRAKKYCQAMGLFAVLRSVRVKAAHKMLVKSTPGRNIDPKDINILKGYTPGDPSSL